MGSAKKKYILRLTDTQMSQLRQYVLWAANDGTYYGNKAQFIARHKAIKVELEVSHRPDGWDYEAQKMQKKNQ